MLYGIGGLIGLGALETKEGNISLLEKQTVGTNMKIKGEILNWECECGCKDIEEILTSVTQSNIITDILNNGYMDYGKISTGGGTFDRLQCLDCGEVISEAGYYGHLKK